MAIGERPKPIRIDIRVCACGTVPERWRHCKTTWRPQPRQRCRPFNESRHATLYFSLEHAGTGKEDPVNLRSAAKWVVGFVARGLIMQVSYWHDNGRMWCKRKFWLVALFVNLESRRNKQTVKCRHLRQIDSPHQRNYRCTKTITVYEPKPNTANCEYNKHKINTHHRNELQERVKQIFELHLSEWILVFK